MLPCENQVNNGMAPSTNTARVRGFQALAAPFGDEHVTHKCLFDGVERIHRQGVQRDVCDVRTERVLEPVPDIFETD